MFAERRFFRPGSSGFGYWLRRCEGFRADSPQGRAGFVEEPRHSSSVEEPDAIAVRAGLFGSLLLIIPTGEVEEIVPEQERMLLRWSPRLKATERTRELGRRLQLPLSTRERGRARREVRAMAAPIRAVTGGADALLRRLARLAHLKREGGERAMTTTTTTTTTTTMTSEGEVPAEAVIEETAAEEPAAEATEEPPVAETAAEEAAAEETAERQPSEEPSETTE